MWLAHVSKVNEGGLEMSNDYAAYIMHLILSRYANDANHW